ncbi:hypothetical protein KFU94_31625 [Chloroflexi bacterium TSY]|nr:hypothetical protein [Chloroflexi bacterium TSY]MBV7332702.1 hypothetical protein [Chloroflexi bacterium TSY]
MNQEFSAAVTGFCAHVRMLSPQSETVKHYESDLNQFGQVIEKRPREIGRQEITTFVTAQLEAGDEQCDGQSQSGNVEPIFRLLGG